MEKIIEVTPDTSNREGLEDELMSYEEFCCTPEYWKEQGKTEAEKQINVYLKSGQSQQVKQASCTHENTVWENQGFTLYCRDCKTSINDRDASQGKPVSECETAFIGLLDEVFPVNLDYGSQITEEYNRYWRNTWLKLAGLTNP